MRGLLLKDWYTLIKQVKFFLLLILVFSVIGGGNMVAFAVVYAAMVPVTALAYDEHAKWNSLAMMMPYSVEKIVFSKYILGYIAIAAAVLLAIAARWIMSMINHVPMDTGMWGMIFFSICAGMILLAVNLPMMFRLGVEKARIVFFVILGLVVGIGMVAGKKIEMLLSSLISPVQLMPTLLAVSAAVLLLSAGSVYVAIKLYRRRVLA